MPAPDGSAHPNYARHFTTLFLETFAELVIHPHLYWMSEQYAAGAMYLPPVVAGKQDTWACHTVERAE